MRNRKEFIMQRRTKIIATLGPATESEEKIDQLIEAGVDTFRLNMSHANGDWIRERVRLVRELSQAKGRYVALLMDMQGPAIRTGDVAEPIELHVGDQIEIRGGDVAPALEKSVDVNYPGLFSDVHPGDKMLVDNGVIHLKILSVASDRLVAEVLTEGILGSRRHINLPGIYVQLPALTMKDRRDFELGIELGVDFFALSFAREAAGVELLRSMIEANRSEAEIIAKLEDQTAINNLHSLIQASDGIMVARGDLGIECDLEELPIIQRRIVKECHLLGKRVIVATHMLESMIENPVPTRAEVTDVANAIYEQADAIMLSGESSVGKYPRTCVEVLDRIAQRIERSGGAHFADEAELATIKEKTARSAVVLANSIEGARLLVFTQTGKTARTLSRLRPHKAPIYAFTPSNSVAHRLSLNWAVIPHVMEFSQTPAQTIDRALSLLQQWGSVQKSDPLVIVSDALVGDFVMDSILFRRA